MATVTAVSPQKNGHLKKATIDKPTGNHFRGETLTYEVGSKRFHVLRLKSFTTLDKGMLTKLVGKRQKSACVKFKDLAVLTDELALVFKELLKDDFPSLRRYAVVSKNCATDHTRLLEVGYEDQEPHIYENVPVDKLELTIAGVIITAPKK